MANDEKLSEKVKNKKLNIVKRTWSWFKSINWIDPLNKWKLAIVLIVAFFGIAFSTYGALAVTSTKSFCKTCHEMAPENVTHYSTTHSELKCVKCHIEPGLPQTMKGKVMALKEVYRHVTRTQPNPIHVRHEVRDVVCLRCHSENRDVTPTGDIIVAHDKHVNKDISCVTCHSGVAHAKVVERGLNTNDLFDYWIMENAEALVTMDYVRPNMGTCIECHQQYNEGLEPWTDKNYAVTIPPNYLDESYEATPSNEMLKLVAKQVGDVEISMECQTCHMEIATPSHHKQADWNENHKANAIQELDQCLTCHQEEKWVRRVRPQTMEQLLNPNKVDLKTYVPNEKIAESESRNTPFCFTCHSEEIPGYNNN